ncbi:MAG: NAD-dependent DNA ligase LigA [Prevotella sp.]
MTEQERITSLRQQLHEHNRLYYVYNDPVISDQDFDFMMHELESLERKHPEMYDANSPTQRVGNDISQQFRQVEHRYPMLSLANTYSESDVRAFYDSVARGLGGEEFEICCEMKYDGLSISLTYEHGALVRAVTRGDGVSGDDVTANVRTIRAIPLRLPDSMSAANSEGGYPETFEVRGEILMPWASFRRLNQEREDIGERPFANPRNAASGTLKSQSSRVVAERGLDAYLYYLLGDNLPADNHYANIEACRSWGFKMSEGMRLCHSLDEVIDFINFWDKERASLPVATDGVVLKVNSLSQQRRLGLTAKSPRWAIAYKYQAERARTRLVSVAYQIGRTGAITPVAEMEPVNLSGTTVRRATLNNEDFILSLGLHIGDYVYVEKGGEIIPKIVGVDKEARESGTQPVRFIETCPVCGSKLMRYDGEAAHYCPNSSGCPPQLKGRIEHFISRKAMNIMALGPETIEDFYARGLVRTVADLYMLTPTMVMGGNANRKVSARKICHAIAESRDISFERVLFALGIRFVGATTAKLLARHFKSVDELANASIGELQEVEGVGSVIAESVVRYFHDERNLDIVNRLRLYGLKMEIEKEDSCATDRLAGQTVVISGVFSSHSRDEYKAIIERNGGKNAGSISGKTSFVLAGDNMGPAKLQKAEKLGVRIMTEEEFLREYKDICD